MPLIHKGDALTRFDIEDDNVLALKKIIGAGHAVAECSPTQVDVITMESEETDVASSSSAAKKSKSL